MCHKENASSGPAAPACEVRIWRRREIGGQLGRWRDWAKRHGASSPSHDPRWLAVLAEGLQHEPYCLEAVADGETAGLLPLALVRSWLFGRFLVSLPYLNSAGVLGDDPAAAAMLVDRAVALADELGVRHLELRHERAVEHPALRHTLTSKVHMRLALPATPDELWKSFDPKVRNQVRKAEKLGPSVQWGGEDLLGSFYDVFAHNMRDLGTPVFSRRLFASILKQFPGEAEICRVCLEGQCVAAGLLVHGAGITEVPSASSLRAHNSTNANMLMYWHLLCRSIERGQRQFDFGRSTPEGNTYRFKKQWGAKPEPAVWQYYVRQGDAGQMRLESGKYNRAVAVWQRLPVWLTRLIGPSIVRGIP